MTLVLFPIGKLLILCCSSEICSKRGLWKDLATQVHYMCCCFSCVRPFVTPWTVALQAPLSMGFSRQEWWSGLSRPLPGELPHPGIELMSLKSPVLTGGFFSISATWEAPTKVHPPLIVQKGGGLHGWQPLLHEPSTSAQFTHPHWVI